MGTLRCLLLPVLGKTLILPYSAVAEVIPYKDEQGVSQGLKSIPTQWLWRGVEIPLICLEKPEGLDLTALPPSSLHIAILNRCMASKGPDFFGLILESLPSMNRFKRADIQAAASVDKPYLSGEVTVKGKAAFIPNLVWIQENLSYFHSAASA